PVSDDRAGASCRRAGRHGIGRARLGQAQARIAGIAVHAVSDRSDEAGEAPPGPAVAAGTGHTIPLMKRDADFFEGAEPSLIYIAKKLHDALALEAILTAAGVDYGVE